MRGRAAVTLATALVAAGAAPAESAMTVRNTMRFSTADGTPVAVGPEIRVWCGPWEGNRRVRTINIRVGGRPALGHPRWELTAVVADVRRRPDVRLPHSFIYNQPRGAQMFAYDGDNEASSSEEESTGTIHFGRVRCGRRMRISFRLDGRLGSELSDRGPIGVKGSLRASRS